VKARMKIYHLTAVVLFSSLFVGSSHAIDTNKNESRSKITCGDFGDVAVRQEYFGKSRKDFKRTIGVPVKGKIDYIVLRKGKPFLGSPISNCIIFRKIEDGKYINYSLLEKRYNHFFEFRKHENIISTYDEIALYSYRSKDKYSDTFYGSGNLDNMIYSIRCSNIKEIRSCDGLIASKERKENVLQFVIFMDDLIYFKNFLRHQFLKKMMEWR